jgi:hypothetical protein
VADSVVMYKQQLKKEEIEKNMKNESLNIISSTDNNQNNNNNFKTNDDSINVDNDMDGATAKSPVVLYWSEDMDIQLAKEVRSCMFDFDLISQRLTGEEMGRADRYIYGCICINLCTITMFNLMR